MTPTSRFYNIEIPGWKYVGSLKLAKMRQDHYEAPLGTMIVSKDWPARGWHVSIHPGTAAPPAEIVEEELKRIYQGLGVPCKLKGRSSIGNYHAHQDFDSDLGGLACSTGRAPGQ